MLPRFITEPRICDLLALMSAKRATTVSNRSHGAEDLGLPSRPAETAGWQTVSKRGFATPSRGRNPEKWEPELGFEPRTCCLQAAIRLSLWSRQRPSRQGTRTSVSRKIPPKSGGVRGVGETNGETPTPASTVTWGCLGTTQRTARRIRRNTRSTGRALSRWLRSGR